MNFKRIGMALVSLVLVCCLLINVSPIKTDAVAIGSSISGWAALLFFLTTSAGIVLNVEVPTEPPAIIQQAEEAFDDYVIGNYEAYFPGEDPDDDDDTDLEQFWEDLKDGVNECFEKFGNFNNLSDFLPQETFADWVYDQAGVAVGSHAIGIGAKLSKLLSGWYMDIYESGTFDVTNNLIVEDGYALYNGVKLPALSNSLLAEYPYCVIGYDRNSDGSSSYRLLCSRYPFQVDQYGFFRNVGYLSGIDYALYWLSSDSTHWEWNHENYVSSNPSSSFNGSAYCAATRLWSSYDLYRCMENGDSLSETGEVVLFGSPVIYTDTEFVSYEPDMFFGDYAEQQENGTLSADSFQFPLYDFSDYINNKDSVRDEMKQVYDQISNGQITYDDYMQNITYNDSIDDNIGGDSSETPGGSNGTYDDYIAGKMNALATKFPLVDSILATANDLKAFLSNLGQKPPIIYIDLGASRGPYDIGGKVPFIDLTWYAEYKPTMDSILSAFLWLWFAWRMFLSLPGILHGSSGLWHFNESHAGQASTSIGSFNEKPLGDKMLNTPNIYVPTESYEELLNDYHMDLVDNPDWEKAFGRNPSYATLKELYTIDLDLADL